MLSSPFSLPTSLPSSPAQLSQLANDPPNKENTNHLHGYIGTHGPSDANNRLILIDQPVTHPSDNIMSLLEPGVSTANSIRNSRNTQNQQEGKDNCGYLSCSYGDSYDADDELPEEDDNADDHDIYFEDPCQTFALRPGMPLPPLLAGDIPPRVGSILSRISPATSELQDREHPTQPFNAIFHVSTPPAVPNGITPITPATPTTPTHIPTPITIPTYTPTTPAETSTLNAWFDLPSTTLYNASPTYAR